MSKTVFNVSALTRPDPTASDAEKATHFLAQLRVRTLESLQTLHVVAIPDAAYCLDLSLQRLDLDALNRACIDKLLSMPRDEVLPAAADSFWSQTYPHAHIRCLKRYVIRVQGRGGTWVGVMVMDGAAMGFDGKGFPHGLD
jgi:hypothetical protein